MDAPDRTILCETGNHRRCRGVVRRWRLRLDKWGERFTFHDCACNCGHPALIQVSGEPDRRRGLVSYWEGVPMV